MTTQISPQIRIVALAGLLLAVAGGAAMLVLGRSHGKTSAPVAAPAPARPATSTPAPAAKTPQAPAKTHAVAPQAAKTAAPAHPAARSARRGNLVDARLPRPLQWALSKHRIVVVSLYNPRAKVDAISVAEAHAGAADAKVGFLLVNVLDNAVAGPMTALLPGGGLLPNPGVLIYRAPGTVVFRFDGFTDRNTILQAARSAADGRVDPSVSDPGLAASSATTAPAGS